MREKEGVQLGGRGVGHDMQRDEGRKTEVIIYCMKKHLFSIKKLPHKSSTNIRIQRIVGSC